MAETWVRMRQESINKLLAAAMIEFAERGYSSARIADVARAASVSHGLVSKYFGTKENLFCEVARAYLHRLVYPSDPGISLYQALSDCIDRIRVCREKSPQQFAFLRMMAGSTDLPVRYDEVRRADFDASPLPKLMQEGIANGELPQAEPLDLFTLLITGTIRNMEGSAEIGLPVPADRNVYFRMIRYQSREDNHTLLNRRKDATLYSLSTEMDAILYVDLNTEEYETMERRPGSRLEEIVPEKGTDYYALLSDLAARHVFPEDREAILPRLTADKLREILRESPRTLLEFRVSRGAGVQYYQLIIARAQGDLSCEYAILAIHDANELFRSRQEAAERYSMIDRDRQRLLTAMKALYPLTIAIDLSENSYHMIEYAEFHAHRAEAAGTYDELIAAGMSTIPDDALRERFRTLFSRRAVTEAFRSGTKELVLNHPQLGDDGTVKWMRVRVISLGEQEGHLRAIAVAGPVDEDIRRDHQNRMLLSALCTDYTAVYYVDLQEDRATAYQVNDAPGQFAEELLSRGIPYSETWRRVAEQTVGDSELEGMISFGDADHLRTALSTQQSISRIYRGKGERADRYTEAKFVRIGKADPEPRYVMVAFADRDDLSRQLLREGSKTTELLASFSTDLLSLSLIYPENGAGEVYDLTRGGDKKTSMRVGFFPDADRRILAALMQRTVPEDRDEVRAFHSLRHLKKAGEKELTIQFRFDRGDGVRWYQSRAVPGKDEQGKPAVILGISDINDRKQYELMLRQRQTEAEQADSAKSRFLFNISHDIRTPLNAILGLADLAARDAEDPEKVRVAMDKAQNAGRQLQEIFDGILELTRVETGAAEITPIPCDLREEVRRLGSVLEPSLKEKELRFESETRLERPYAFTDAAIVRQILLHILDNSVKYTQNGGIIRYRLRQGEALPDGRIRYLWEIRDNGSGMSAEFLPRIFDRFAREHTAAQCGVEGAGLGMTLVRELVDRLEGDVVVESEAGFGTTVRLEIPLMPCTAADLSEQSLSRQLRSLAGMRLMLVDDNDLNREIGADLLEHEGFTVDQAESGEEAIRLLTEKGPGVYAAILMDIQMPGMDGYEATRRIRALPDPELSNIPITALSANTMEEDRRRSREAGMNDHVSKPVDLESLLRVLNRIIPEGNGIKG